MDRLIIGVLNNSAKKPVFTAEERVHMLELVIKDIPNAAVETFDGLTVEFAKSLGATVIAQTNHALNPDIDTVFLTTSVKYSYLSSSIVKEVASYEGDISKFVPGEILPFVTGKIKNLRSVDNGNGQKQ